MKLKTAAIKGACMNPKKFASVNLCFRRKLSDDDLQEIENKLRNFEQVGNFSANPSKISFSISAENEVDYRAVDELKRMLKRRLQRIPQITVFEYIRCAKKKF